MISTLSQVQAALNQLGYKGSNGLILTVDGVSGPNTQYAVKAFQAAHGLTVDGKAGPLTMAALDAASAVASVTGSPPPTGAPPAAGAATSPAAAVASAKQAVAAAKAATGGAIGKATGTPGKVSTPVKLGLWAAGLAAAAVVAKKTGLLKKFKR